MNALRGVGCWLGMLCLFARSALAAEETEPVAYREVRVHVVDESGASLPGVMVYLVGPGRDARTQPEDVAGWRFLSDARGRCVVRLGCFHGFDSRELTGQELPGWGLFYFVASSGYLRGVSQGVVHDNREDPWVISRHDEWTRRGLLRTSDRRLEVTLRMRRGLRVSGRVIDTAGRPVPGCAVGLQHDLHSESHTGYGGELFIRSTTTDAHGRFVFEHVFPNTFYPECASLREDDLPVWVRTAVRGRWRNEPVYAVTPRRGEQEIRLTFEVSPKLLFRYYGRVTDPAGQPVPDATVTLGVSQHRTEQTWLDGHHTLADTTDEDGQFEVFTATPFVHAMWVTATGFVDDTKYYDEGPAIGRLHRPGEWNIVLRRR